ncbi:MAG: integrin alpha [Planctomycetota bacterium]|nr:integrin alpha [Planctomycetota bacterium]
MRLLPTLLVTAAFSLSAQAQVGVLITESPDLSPLGYTSDYGSTVAGIGDDQDSGTADILVGQPLPHAVAAYLRDGRTGAVLHKFTSLHGGPSTVNRFGSAVSGLPDVTGDGRDDLLIAGYKESISGGGATGRVYVYERPLPGGTPTLLHELTPPAGSNLYNFGWDVEGMQDVDGDGFGEVLVGQPGAQYSSIQYDGHAFLYSGKTGALLRTFSHPDVSLPSTRSFGQSVAAVPDVDGDGLDDVAVAAPFVPDLWGTYTNLGVSVFSSATGALIRKLDPVDPWVGDWGISLAGIEDLNGDGRGELLVGHPAGVGRVHVFSVIDGVELAALSSLVPDAVVDKRFGTSVSGAGDANGDGVADILIGAPGEWNGGFQRGRAYAFSGADFSLLSVLEVPQHYSPGQGWTSRLGQAVSLMPDANGDGKAEYLVGAPNLVVPGTPDGVTLTYFCETEVLSKVAVELGSPANPDVLGWSGHPILGEALSVQIDHASFAPTAVADVVLVAAGSASLPLPGGTLLVDPAALLLVRVAAPGAPVPLALPALCDLAGIQVLVQGASLVGSDFLATNGLVVTLGTQ